METGLAGKVVLVTGGAGGIGKDICRAFSNEGSKVIIHYNSSKNSAEELASEIGGIAIHADLRNENEAIELVNEIVKKNGDIDICVANAGNYPTESKSFWEIDSSRWLETLNSNLMVAVNSAKAFLIHASEKKKGSIVFIASTAGIFGESGHADYATAKGAISSGLLMTLKNDVSKLGIRVNAVAPGWTLTPKQSTRSMGEELIQRATATMALKKLAIPKDVASAVLMLSSDEISGHVSGQVIQVAGGMEGRIID